MIAVALPGAAARTEQRVGTTNLVWLTLRQHRALILCTLAACAVLVGYLLAWRLMLGDQPIIVITAQPIRTVVQDGVIAYSLLVAMLWGAPLLSREYEQRTNVLVWSQDVSPTRWLLTKVALLGVIVAGLAAVVEWVCEVVSAQIIRSMAGLGWMALEYQPGFESNIGLQAGYALAAFGLGVAIGGFVRIPVVAMVATGVVFGLTRWLLTVFARYHYLPPTHTVGPLNNMDNVDALVVLDSGDSYVDYQPESRLLSLRLIEVGVYLGIAALCVAIAWFEVGRRQRV